MLSVPSYGNASCTCCSLNSFRENVPPPPPRYTKVLAIIPCYNEEKNLISTVENLKAKTPFVDFIVVNDGSKDNTYRVCVENHYPVIDMPFNLGLANAIQTGMRYAYSNGYEMAIQFDGDGQHIPSYIPEMIKLMQNTSADIVIGSRYMQKRSRDLRGLGSSFLRINIKIVTGKTISDPTSGMRLYNRKMIEAFTKQMNYGPEPDTLTYLINQGITILETPVTMQERKSGKSYLTMFASMSYMLRMFISINFIQWFRVKKADI
jgi:glycosyltransferase involved in cell wall biosynthesis